MLKEVAGILAEIAPNEGYKFYDRVAGEIHNKYMVWFKAEIEKLAVIKEDKLIELMKESGCTNDIRIGVNAKLALDIAIQDFKKQLLGLMEE
uniref:Uncharacterized protein n=1 Tax=viral metagenome TaxID=1070528 RepID=A0A6M3LW80_9ZZZZ